MREKTILKIETMVIKIGSGLVTKNSGINTAFFRNLSKQVFDLKKKKINVVLVSSGAIACGMHVLGLHKRPQRLEQKQAVAATGQPVLMQYFVRTFSKNKMKVAQILLTRDDFNNQKRYRNAQNAIMELLREGIVPIVNENDTVSVDEIQFGDNDKLSAFVARLIKADLLVMLTDINGFYDKDPKTHPHAGRVSVVTKIDRSHVSVAGGSQSEKSTGGMITKLIAARYATKNGIPAWVANGRSRTILSQIINREDVGTLFLPANKKR